MQLVGSRGQMVRDLMHRADGALAAGGAPQLVLCERPSTSMLIIQNTSISSGDPLWFEFGSARATCAISNGAVSSVTVKNGGFNFTYAPTIEAFGGGNVFPGRGVMGGSLGHNVAGSFLAPTRPARLVPVMTGSAGALSVASVTILDGGAGYVKAPELFIQNSLPPLDPYGCADPAVSSGSGMVSYAGASFTFNGTVCPTDQIAVYGATTGDSWALFWKD